MATRMGEMTREERLERIRHSTAHIMAEAVQSLYPEVKFGIGPVIEDGFYYDFDLDRPFAPEDLPRIEAKMQAIVDADTPFEHADLSPEQATEMFASQPYKLELIRDFGSEPISIYHQHEFTDLCRGPHVDRTGDIKAFKLLHTAGAYWRGDEKRPMLQRIYGTAWETQDDLAGYLHRLEEAARRDHRRLGKELDLFSIHEEGGAGLIYWHPKGARVRGLIEDFWRQEHFRSGYELVYSPHIGKADLWETSGHLGFYKDAMFAPMDVDGQEYYLKPMNCPFHIMMYKNALRSYRELPMRLAELGTVYRFERSGVLHGLMRVRGFTQDDAHIFCRPDQLIDEVGGVIEFTLHILRSLGFTEFEAYLSTRPEKAVGDPADWVTAEDSLRRALDQQGLAYDVDEGGGAFYGPKIDLKIKDALGRAWQCSTVQFDFNEPERFDLTYIGDDGAAHRPYMVHRALLGSMERFFGVLIEHYAGAFPVWLAPVQAVVIPIADRHLEYARRVADRLQARDLRVVVDSGPDRMNAKIRHAQLQKVPYMLVVGDKEAEQDAVSLRLRSNENLGAVPIDEFIARAEADVRERRA